MRLFTPSGRPIAADISTEKLFEVSDGLLHVLLEKEAWVWPGVRVGMRWRVAGILLETVAMAPRAILVHNCTTAAEAASLIKTGSPSLSRSPEKHYSAGYENYRTSQTGSL